MPKAPGRPASKRPLPANRPAPQTPPAPAADPPVALRPHLWRILALWAIALLAYANSFPAGMTLDNRTILLQDTRLQAATTHNIGMIFSEEYWYGNGSTNLYRPFTTLTYLFNYSILGNGANPAGYHAINFFIHIVNIGLVYLLGLLIFRQAGFALGLAGIWGLHPVLTESVTNIVGRADMLAAFGVLSALLCHIYGANAGDRKRIAWLAGITAASAIGLFSKESAIVVLAVLPLYDWIFGGGNWRKRLAGYAATLPAVLAFFYFRGAMLAKSPIAIVPFVDNPLTGAGFWTSRLTAIRVIGKLFALCIWPAALSCDYSYNQIPLFSWRPTWPDFQAMLALLGCIAAAILAFRYRRRIPALAFFAAFWFVAIAPTANIAILIGSIMAERFLYLPLIGVAGCLVLAIGALADRFSAGPAAAGKAAATAVGVICLAYSVRTVVRNADWRDEISLWSSAARTSPGSFKAHVSYAVALAAAGKDLDTSTGQADHAVAILSTIPDDRNNSIGYYQAGFCYRTKGDADPPASQSWYGKARDTLVEGVKIDRISTEQARSVNLEAGKGPYLGGQTRLYDELGRVYLLLHQPKEALPVLADGRAISPKPAFSEAMSQAYRDLGNRDGAAIALLEGLVLDPEAAGLPASLVKVYQDLYPESCAVTRSGTSFAINMECPLVHGQLCTASVDSARDLQTRRRPRSASRIAQTAITQFACPASMFQ